MGDYSFRYGGETFQYDVCFTSNHLNKISIHVHPNASVQVDAPIGRSKKDINEAVLKRARWIISNINNAKQRNEHVLPRQYISGENVFYLGRRYQLKIHTVQSDETSVKLVRGYLNVSVPSADTQLIKDQIKSWYRDRAKEVFQRRLDAVNNEIVWLSNTPEWRLFSMQKQWGSCSPKGVLLFNPHLVKAPRECVDYVIRHEICHLREHNHSKKYYRLLEELMPDWKSVKAKLDGMAEMLLNE